MSIGPVEYIAIAFPGNQFKGEIYPALQELVDNKTIKILDLIFINKDANGDIEAIELSQADATEAAVLDVLGVAGTRLLGEEDIEEIGNALDPNSSAALMIWENVWGARIRRVAPKRERDPDRQRADPGGTGRGGHGRDGICLIGRA